MVKDDPKTETKKEVKKKEVIEEAREISLPMPILVKLTEFINSSSIRRGYKVETLGGFLHWVSDKAPTKLPFEGWKKLLDQFANRIV